MTKEEDKIDLKELDRNRQAKRKEFDRTGHLGITEVLLEKSKAMKEELNSKIEKLVKLTGRDDEFMGFCR